MVLPYAPFQRGIDILDRCVYEGHLRSIVERHKTYEKGASADELNDMCSEILCERCDQPKCGEGSSKQLVVAVHNDADPTHGEMPLDVVNDFSDVATTALLPGQCAAVKVNEDVMSAAATTP